MTENMSNGINKERTRKVTIESFRATSHQRRENSLKSLRECAVRLTTSDSVTQMDTLLRDQVRRYITVINVTIGKKYFSYTLSFHKTAVFDPFQEFSCNLFHLFDVDGSGSLTNGEWLDLVRTNIR